MHIDEKSYELKHPANRRKLCFVGGKIWRKINYYLDYERMGKANIFYALYPRESLQKIKLLDYEIDFQIIFSLLDNITVINVPGPYLYKRVHDNSDGHVAATEWWQKSQYFAPVRLLIGDLRFSLYLLKYSNVPLKIILFMLTPLKLLIGLKFHFIRGMAILRDFFM